jgi:hypothetical protein
MKNLMRSLMLCLFCLPLALYAEEHEEENTAIGPDKGITEKGDQGFKLAPEAIETFGLSFQDYSGGQITVSNDAIVRVKESQTLFRQREGWFERVEIISLSRNGGNATVQAKGLQAGDKVVVKGVGFLRTAEVIAEEGAGHEH